MTEEDAKEYIKSHPEIYFKKAEKSGYVCTNPDCKNGSGKDGTGINLIPDVDDIYKCHVCGAYGDIFKFIGLEYGLTNYNAKLQKAFDIYGLIVDYSDYTANRSKKIAENIEEKEEPNTVSTQEQDKPDYTTLYKNANNELNDDYEKNNKTNYLTQRGISIEVQNQFNIGFIDGFMPNFNMYAGIPCLIIPTSKSSYISRNVNCNTDSKDNYKYYKTGVSHIFNAEILGKSECQPVFIAEGEIDALSFIEVGYHAIALGGATNVKLLIKELEKVGEIAKNRRYILCLDNDNAGRNACRQLQEASAVEDQISQDGWYFIDQSSKILGNFKDANEALVKDKAKFVAAISAAIKESPAIDNVFDNYVKTLNARIADDAVSSPKIANSSGIEKESVDYIPRNDEIDAAKVKPNFAELGKTEAKEDELAKIDTENEAKRKQSLLKVRELLAKIDTENEAKKKAEKETKKEAYLQSRINKLMIIKKRVNEGWKPIPTGFKVLDTFLDGGFYTGLHILAGESGVGKTTFALQIADHMAKNKQHVLYFSVEMSADELIAKRMSRMSKETAGKDDRKAMTTRISMNVRSTNNADYIAVRDNIFDKIVKLNEFFDIFDVDDKIQNIEEIKNAVEKYVEIMDTSPVVFIDYLQEVKVTGYTPDNKKGQVDELVSVLRIMASRYKIPVVAISSVNRAGYSSSTNSKTHIPKKKWTEKSDLKESGDIEFGADVILALNQGNKSNDEFSKIKLQVLKGRMGKRHVGDDCIDFNFNEKYNYFENVVDIKKLIITDSKNDKVITIDMLDKK
jgi:replicative DNA helicase